MKLSAAFWEFPLFFISFRLNKFCPDEVSLKHIEHKLVECPILKTMKEKKPPVVQFWQAHNSAKNDREKTPQKGSSLRH